MNFLNDPWIQQNDFTDQEDSPPGNNCTTPAMRLDEHQHPEVCEKLMGASETIENHLTNNSCRYECDCKIGEDTVEMRASNTKISVCKEIYLNFIRFCETTSLRGVPKIIKSKDKKRKFLWIFFVVALFLGCIVCIVIIISQYFEMDVIHQPKTEYDNAQPFPSITLCNLRPFSKLGTQTLIRSKVHPMGKYFSALVGAFFKLRNLRVMKLSSFAANLNNYLNNLPEGLDPIELGHSRTSLIHTCSIVYRKGESKLGRICESVGQWTRTEDNLFHNCFTLKLDEKYIKPTESLDLVLYLDNDNMTECYSCQDRLGPSQLTGVRLQLHSAGTVPEVKSKGIYLMPGSLTEIIYRTNRWNLMEPPHGKCNPNHDPYINFSHVSYNYTQYACLNRIRQLLIARRCNCIDSGSPIPNEYLHYAKEKKFCDYIKYPSTLKGNMVLDMNETMRYIENIECSQKVNEDMDKSFRDDHKNNPCPMPCQYYLYDTSISSAKWPAKPYQASFYFNLVTKLNKYKKEMERKINHQKKLNFLLGAIPAYEQLVKRLHEYSIVNNLTRLGKHKEAWERLSNLDFMEKNLLSIQISRTDFDFTNIKEKAVISTTSLLSQIGGLLSIWIGLSFVIIVEIIELLLNIFEGIANRKQSIVF